MTFYVDEIKNPGQCVHGVSLADPCQACWAEEGRPRAKALSDALVADVAAGLRVLRSRDGVNLSEDQIMDRARNIVAGLVGNYRIEERT